jgi:hypothetical protein
MNREVHVRICESLGVKLPLATRLRGSRQSLHDINKYFERSVETVYSTEYYEY